MPERRTPDTQPPAEEPRAPLFSANEIRIAFVASAVGMAGLLVLILLLATSRPQGSFQVADDTQFQGIVAAAAEDLDGYELVGDSRARIDIDRAMELVAERGVDLPLTALGTEPATAEVEAADGDGGDGGDGGAAAADGTADGEAVYASNCASCHQGNGQGIPGAFPPLAGGHMPSLVAAEGGREYLIDVLLYGLQGAIEVQGQTYNGLMPAWPQLSDDEIAAVLNHELTAWDNEGQLPDGFEPIVAEEVAAARGQDLSPSAVLEMRPEPGAEPAASGAPAEEGDEEPAAQEDDDGEAEAEALAEEAGESTSAQADAADEEDPAEEADEDAADSGDDGAADPADEAADEGEGEGDAAAAPAADGEPVYAANCASCHQGNGQGIPGAFPPLAGGHMPSLVAAEGGRAFLIDVLLYGLQGAIDVQGQTYNGVMPAWQHLSDADIAAVLNHELTAWDNEGQLPDGFEPIAPDEVAAARGEGLSPSDVLDLRPAMD